MAMRARVLRLSDRERSDRLTGEIEEWKYRGYRVQTRTPTTAHLVKPAGSALPPILGWLILSGLAWLLFVGIFGPLPLLIASGAALILILAWQSGRRDELVQLTADPDGTVYRE